MSVTAFTILHPYLTQLGARAFRTMPKRPGRQGSHGGRACLIDLHSHVLLYPYNQRRETIIGAEEADGVDSLTRVVRDQIRRGADGRHVAAHATTAEGMRRATLAGVRTIEHSWPNAAPRSVRRSPPLRVARGRRDIANGSDVAVFAHGDNARELTLLVDYGMSPVVALEAATSVATDVVDLGGRSGRSRAGAFADLVAVGGDPSVDISGTRDVRLVVQRGREVQRAAPGGSVA